MHSQFSESIWRDFQFDPFHCQQFGVLLGEGVLGLGENCDQLVFRELFEHGNHWQSSDKFRNKAKTEQVFGLDVLQDFVPLNFRMIGLIDRVEAHDSMTEPALNNIFQPDKCAAADEQNACRVDANIFLLRMLATALGRNVADGAFKNLEQGLLDAFP